MHLSYISNKINRYAMKIKNLLLSAAAALLALAGCQKPEDLGPAAVQTSLDEMAFEIAGGSQTLELTATLDWGLRNYTDDIKEWLVVDPSSGKAAKGSQTITIKVLENAGADREAILDFYGDILHHQYVTVRQKGPKGDANVLTVKEFIEKADTQNEYVLNGTVKNIFTSSYTTFDLVDETGSILVYSFTNIDSWLDKLANGGKISLRGTYQYYASKSQHEVVNATILSFEGAEPIDPSKIQQITVGEFLTKADANTTYRLKGKVENFNSQYTSFNLNDGTGSIYVYSVDAASKSKFGSQLKNGATATITGNYYWYENASDASKSKAEIMNANIEAVEAGSTDPDDGGDDYKNAPAKSVADFIAAADKDHYYKLTGTVSGFNSQYCSFDLTDASGKIYVYSVANKADWSSKVKNGGTVVLAGKYDYYASKNQHEVIEAYILSFSEGEAPTPGEIKYKKLDLANFQEGLYAIATVSDGQCYIMKNEVKASYYVTATAYDLSKNVAPSSDFLFKVAKSGDGYTIQNSKGTYVGVEVSGTHYNLKPSQAAPYVWKFEALEDGAIKATGADSNGNCIVFYGNYTEFSMSTKTDGAPTFYLIDNAGETPEQPGEGGGDQPGEGGGDQPGEGGGEQPIPEGSVIFTYPDELKQSIGSYTDTWQAKIGEAEFTLENFNNNKAAWNFIKCGRKSDDSVASIATSKPLAKKISKVVVTVDNVLSAAKVKSTKLIVAKDAAFTDVVETVEVAVAKGDMTYNVAAPAEGLYYKLVYDCLAHGSSNGIITISKIVYTAAE